MIKRIEDLLIKHEGLKLKPYRCPAGKLTIGVGRNLEDVGITESEAMYLLRMDIERCEKELRCIFEDFDDLPKEIQNVLIDMIFNLGKSRFMNFKKMIQAVKVKNWGEMANEMKNSNWYHQVKNRAEELVQIVKKFS